MRRKVLILVGLLYVSVLRAEMADAVSLPDVEVSVSRIARPASQQQMQMSVVDSKLIEQAQVQTPKDISSLAPNIYMPDYGSAMTSSIYIRGMGSRINEPVMTMVVDGVPLMDKNMYDHALQDVKRIELLRGAQGSLYGRNSPAGVMEIRTLQPLDLTTYTVRGLVSYGTANSVKAQASYYSGRKADFGWGMSARYQRTEGFYTNAHDGQLIDGGQQAGGKLIFDAQPTEAWRLTGTVYADWVKQGAFPYASVATGRIAYNRPSSYERLAILPTVRADYFQEGYRLRMVASYQYMHDDMLMDQDYTPADIFTLRQTQRQHNATFDALLQAPKPCDWFEWTVGLSAFTKMNTMQASVTFMREGIEELILSNANRGLQTAFPTDTIKIRNAELPIASDFDLLNTGTAAYYQSHFQFGQWHINAGLRMDYEYTRMDYLSTAQTDYLFTWLMDDYETVNTRIEGTKDAHYWQVVPRVAVSYDAEWGTFYGYAAKGYKAGGFNPQIFSTITQNQVMTDIAADMGIHLDVTDPRFSDVSITSYKPERDWTFEVGAHFTPVEGLQMDLAGFHTQCYDQQVTVFPNGKTTGRMMANAAQSHIWGGETTLHYRWKEGKWQGIMDGSYGFTDARFVEFNDGMGDYAGNTIPYCPQNTLHGLASVEYHADKNWLQSVGFTLRADGIGRIYWNEQNDCSQPLYGLLGATLHLKWQHLQLQLWSRNLTDTQYNVFYFRSMGNDFLQRGKPRELGANIIINI